MPRSLDHTFMVAMSVKLSCMRSTTAYSSHQGVPLELLAAVMKLKHMCTSKKPKRMFAAGMFTSLLV